MPCRAPQTCQSLYAFSLIQSNLTLSTVRRLNLHRYYLPLQTSPLVSPFPSSVPFALDTLAYPSHPPSARAPACKHSSNCNAALPLTHRERVRVRGCSERTLRAQKSKPAKRKRPPPIKPPKWPMSGSHLAATRPRGGDFRGLRRASPGWPHPPATSALSSAQMRMIDTLPRIVREPGNGFAGGHGSTRPRRVTPRPWVLGT